jgi:hypothetical protein
VEKEKKSPIPKQEGEEENFGRLVRSDEAGNNVELANPEEDQNVKTSLKKVLKIGDSSKID